MPPEPAPPSTTQMPAPGRLREIALVFLKLGSIAFGGPAAHVAMMEEEIVKRRQWLTSREFLDMLGATNLIPGPNSTEMSLHIGYHRGGMRGLLVAGCSFILPAACIVFLLALIYVRFRSLPAADGILYGIKPVIIAIVAQALWRLGRIAVRTRFLAFMGMAAFVANFAGVGELIVLFAGAAIVVVAESWMEHTRGGRSTGAWLAGLCLSMAAGVAKAGTGAVAAFTTGALGAPPPLLALFAIFLKIGSVLFGSGYVLLAFLRADLVERLGWMTESQLLDAVAVGQVIPGPLFTTATFIGYILAGPAGAVVATAGIFLPSFFFVALTAPMIARLRKSTMAGRFLDGLNVTSLALMAVVTWQLLAAAVVDPFTGLLAAGSAALLLRYQINSIWLVLGGAMIGLIAAGLGVRS